MNDEIKEIIREIESFQNEECCIIVLTQKQNKALLSYITKLKQDNEMYAQLKNEYEEEIKDLQQELEEEKRIEEADLHIIQTLEAENKKFKKYYFDSILHKIGRLRSKNFERIAILDKMEELKDEENE